MECGRCQHTLIENDTAPEAETESPHRDATEPAAQIIPKYKVASSVLSWLTAELRWKRTFWSVVVVIVCLILIWGWSYNESASSQVVGAVFIALITIGVSYIPFALIERRKSKSKDRVYKSKWKRVYWSLAGGITALISLDSATRNENAISVAIGASVFTVIFYLPIWIIVKLVQRHDKKKSAISEPMARSVAETVNSVRAKPINYEVSAPKLTTRTSTDWRKLAKITIILLLLIVAPKVIGYIGDTLTIATADSSMKQLAQDAGMSRKGELIFLHANPTYASTEDMSSNCKAVYNGNGYVEQGCYDPSANTIYIRSMTSELHGVEVVTAAHEMLHAAYGKLDSPQLAQANTQIEEYYKGLTDPDLTGRMAYYEKTEPGAKDNELNSIIGTEQIAIPDSFENYYDGYFSDRSIVTAANKSALSVFDNYTGQMNTLTTEYNTFMNAANHAYALAQTAYYDSTTWAEVGNAYENDRNYNIYLQDFNIYKQDYEQADAYAKQHDDLAQKYNDLEAQYNGQPISQINVPQQAAR